MRIVLLSAIISVCFNACNSKDNIPNGILPKAQMQAVLWDIMQAESFTASFIKKDVSKDPLLEDAKLQQQIFTIHHISKDDFYKSYTYYKEHTGLLLTVLDSMTAQENRKENERTRIDTKVIAKADSVKMARIKDSIKISGQKVKNIFLKQKQTPLLDSVRLNGKWKKHLLLKKHKINSAT